MKDFNISDIVYIVGFDPVMTQYTIYEMEIVNITDTQYVFNPAGTEWYVDKERVFANRDEADEYGMKNIQHLDDSGYMLSN